MELDFRKDPTVLVDIIDAMAAGLFTVDAQGRFVAWSDGAERITGYTTRDVLGQPCDMLEGGNCKGFASLANLLRADGSAEMVICNQECKIAAKDGRELYVVGNIRPLTGTDGKPCGAVGTFHDMTSFILANERIAVLQRQTHTFENMVGTSPVQQDVYRRIKLAAGSDVTTLITGESGTGKELAAAAIHAQSARRDQPFLAINCAAIPETLLESELFGHVKGAYTGAVRDRLGVFEAAEGGTLFLDEIGDVPASIQIKLLRVLQQYEIRRVGDDRDRKVDVRLVTATNQNLHQLINSGKMREDFFYRIHVFEIRIPPLRERKGDISLLVSHFINELSRRQDRKIDGISRDAMALIMDFDWPGNIRQLRNAIEHAMVTVAGDRISVLDLPRELRHRRLDADPSKAQSAQELSNQQKTERDNIVEALRKTGGNRTKAAQLLGTSRVTLWKKMGRYAIH